MREILFRLLDHLLLFSFLYLIFLRIIILYDVSFWRGNLKDALIKAIFFNSDHINQKM